MECNEVLLAVRSVAVDKVAPVKNHRLRELYDDNIVAM
jgi:hypothetical protein